MATAMRLHLDSVDAYTHTRTYTYETIFSCAADERTTRTPNKLGQGKWRMCLNNPILMQHQRERKKTKTTKTTTATTTCSDACQAAQMRRERSAAKSQAKVLCNQKSNDACKNVAKWMAKLARSCVRCNSGISQQPKHAHIHTCK